jgi:hypothetical protein
MESGMNENNRDILAKIARAKADVNLRCDKQQADL